MTAYADSVSPLRGVLVLKLKNGGFCYLEVPEGDCFSHERARLVVDFATAMQEIVFLE